MQSHGDADVWWGAPPRPAPPLFTGPAPPANAPAVTLRAVGSGQAAAFTYDLARSVVQTRQGNPAWAGQAVDGVDGIGATEMFNGAARGQADWNNLAKAQIPIADEQQRLLGNVMQKMNQAKKPLPRFWYFPRNLKAVVVMTGDDHGNGGTVGRWNEYISQSPAGCSVANWE